MMQKKPKTFERAFLITVICLASILPLAAKTKTVTDPLPYGPTPSERQLRWHDIEAYSLIHFSMATFSDKEWAYGDQPPSDFNPSDFSADQIVEAIKAADLKGVILVAKHHDGFCLWPTETTPYSVKSSSWKGGKGDVVKAFADATRNKGLLFGLYCSPWDRNYPEFARPAYVNVYHRQLKELWTRYGKLFEVWFDGAFGGSGYYGGARESRSIPGKNYYEFPKIFKMLRTLQPDAVAFGGPNVDVRWCGNERGFVNDPYWPTQTRNGDSWSPAECDFPLRPGWFYHAHQNGKARSPQKLIETYYMSVGRGASFNIGLSPDKRGRLHDDDVAKLKKFGEWKRKTFSKNLAEDAKAIASNTRGNVAKFSARNVLDGKKNTYWATDDQVKTPSLVLELGKKTTFNVVSLREYLPLGIRIDSWALDSWQDGEWEEFSKGTSIGNRRLVRAPEISTTRVRLRITKAVACPALREFALHREPDWSRNSSSQLPQNFGMDKKGWKIHDFSFEAIPGGNAERVIDNDIRTLWNTYGKDGEHGAPQYVAVDMGKDVEIKAFLCMPRTDGVHHSLVDRYRYEVSQDGKNWKKVAEGEFENIRNNPILQTVKLNKPVKARYFRFTGLHVLGSVHMSVAELGVIGK